MAMENVVRDEPSRKDEAERGRGRPKKRPRNTPETRPFDEIAAGLQAIPKKGGAWYRAKEVAQAIIDTDKDLLLQPSCMRLMQAILANFNHALGFDFGTRDHYAALCGMHETTYSRAMRYLCRHGYVLRRRVRRPGAYDLWETTLPVVLAGHAAAERKRVAGKSNSGSGIIEFPVQSGYPNGYTIPMAAAAAGEGESASPSLKIEDSAVRGEGVLAFLSDEHLDRFHQVDARWGGAIRPAEQMGRYLQDLVVLARKAAPPDDVEKALVLALASAEEEAARPSRNKRGHFTNYFSKAFDGQLRELRTTRLEHEEQLRHVPELEAAKHAASLEALNVRTAVEKQIGQLRVESFGQTAAANRVRADQAKPEARPRGARDGGDWYVTGADGRQLFVDHAKLLRIAFHPITGAMGNRILRAVPEATVQDVHDILVEVSEEFDPEQKRSPSDKNERKDVPIATITNKATHMLEVKLAYVKHGPPEQLCGGKYAPGMRSTWLALSEDLVAAVKQECPLVDGEEQRQVWLHVAGFAETNRARYGQGLQQEAEAKFKELMALCQQKAVERAQQKAKQAEAAEQQRREHEAKLQRDAESEARALYGDVAWDAFPASEQGLILAEAVKSLWRRGQLGDAERRKDDEGFRLAEQQVFQAHCQKGGRLADWLELDREKRDGRVGRRLVADELEARKNEPGQDGLTGTAFMRGRTRC